MSNPTVLIVDDERTLARSIKTFLSESGYDAEVATDGEKALELLESLRPDVVFADVRLPGMGGIELLQRIREYDATLKSMPDLVVAHFNLANVLAQNGNIDGAIEE